MRQRIRADLTLTPEGLRSCTVEHEDGRVLSIDDGPGERVSGLLLPGLINAHTHLELSWLRGRVPGGVGLEPWVLSLLSNMPPGDVAAVRAAAAAAVDEAIGFGTVAVGDIQGTTLATAALVEAGMLGTVHREVIVLEPGPCEVGEIEELAPGLVSRPSPHAPYSTWPGRIQAACGVAGPPAAIHLDEDPDERLFLATGGGRWATHNDRMGREWRSFSAPGCSPVRYMEQLGVLGPELALVHMTCAEPEDLRLVAEAGSQVVLCPRSNLHIGGRLPDVPAMVEAGVTLALGTDSLASCPDLDLLAEVACLLEAFPGLELEGLLQAATAGGATALGRADLGRIAPGCRPGLVLVDTPTAGSPRRWLHRPS